jgi:hypothetical protein
MTSRTKGKNSEVVYRGGHPRAVLLDIDEYRSMLESPEDIEDLRM